MAAVGCQGKHICLVSENDDEILSSYPLYDNKAKTKWSMKLDFDGDLITRRVIVKRMPDAKRIADLNGVQFDPSLRTVMGVFNPHLANVTLTLVDKSVSTMLNLNTLHPRLFMSEDNYTIANTPITSSFRKGLGYGCMKKYLGVLGDIAFPLESVPSDIPIVFGVTISIEKFYKDLFRSADFLFEVGFTRMHLVDKENTLRSHSLAWVVDGSRCKGSIDDICLII